jgi:predicted dehydrogenase
MSEGTLRAAIVGLRHGHMGSLNPAGTRGLLGTFRQMGGVDVVALCEREDTAALERELAYAPGVRGYRHVEELLQREAFDFAVVAMPAVEVPPAAVALLEQGKHCFLEKSVARTAAEFWPVVEAARRSGAHVHVNFPWRHHPAMVAARELIDAGTLGRPITIAAEMTTSQVGRLPGQRNPGSFAYRYDGEGGGMLHWLGGHFLEVLRFLMGDVVAVSAMCAPVVGNMEAGPTMDDVSSVSLRFAGGAVGTLHTGYLNAVAGENRDFVRVWGTDGNALWPALGPQLVASSRAPAWASTPTRTYTYGMKSRSGVYGNSQWMFDVAQRFVDGIRTGTPPAVGAIEGLRVLEITDAAYRSSEERRWVDLAPRQ